MLTDEVSAGLDAHLEFFENNARAVLVANRGELAGDPTTEAIIIDELAQLRNSMLDSMGVTGRNRDLAAAALYGWLAFVRAMCVEWLDQAQLSRAEVREVCLRTLTAAISVTPSRRLDLSKTGAPLGAAGVEPYPDAETGEASEAKADPLAPPGHLVRPTIRLGV